MERPEIPNLLQETARTLFKGDGAQTFQRDKGAGPLPTARGIQRIVKQYVKKLGQSITINRQY